jgi:hypothetical protein
VRALLVRFDEVISLGKVVRPMAGRLTPLVRVGSARWGRGLARPRGGRVDNQGESRAAMLLRVHAQLFSRNRPDRSTRPWAEPLPEQARSFEQHLKNSPRICGKQTFFRRCTTWLKSLAKAILFPVPRWRYLLGIGRDLR